MLKISTFGAELEKTVSNITTSNSYAVSQNFFKRLKNAADQRRIKSHYHFSDLKKNVILGLVSDALGEQGVDNGFNLLETALPYQISLKDLHQKMLLDLQTTQEALKMESASIVNLSIHPLGKRDMKTYKKMVAPKGVYPYIWYRGWDHSAGIDAKAQNSPTTGVTAWEAADAVSVIIGAGAAFVALFANGPFEEGRLSPFKDARLNMWDTMMRNAKVEGDRLTAKFPPKRFQTLADYFNWMFGGKTGIHFVLSENAESRTDYKSIGDRILIVDRNPKVLSYLAKKNWQAQFLKDIQQGIKKIVTVKPKISHMEAMQFAQFAGARIRYGLKYENFPLEDFLMACRQPAETKVEEIFEKFAKYVYIEGRDPGANFPDQEVVAAGKNIAKSVVISPSAIQAGLIKKLKKTIKHIAKYPWEQLGQLREAAIKDGFDGKVDNLTVKEFTRNILDLAHEGLKKEEQWMLEYPRWVLKTKQNGADRARKFVENHKKSRHNAIVDLVKLREIILI